MELDVELTQSGDWLRHKQTELIFGEAVKEGVASAPGEMKQGKEN